MTTITIVDELIEEAKRFGWNEKTLTDEVSQFIRFKISLMQFCTTTDNKDKKTLSADVARVAGVLKDEIGKDTTQTPLEEDLLQSWEDIKNGDIEVIDDDYINQIIEHTQKREFYAN